MLLCLYPQVFPNWLINCVPESLSFLKHTSFVMHTYVAFYEFKDLAEQSPNITEFEILFYGFMKNSVINCLPALHDKFVFAVSGALIEMYTSTCSQQKTKSYQLGSNE